MIWAFVVQNRIEFYLSYNELPSSAVNICVKWTSQKLLDGWIVTLDTQIVLWTSEETKKSVKSIRQCDSCQTQASVNIFTLTAFIHRCSPWANLKWLSDLCKVQIICVFFININLTSRALKPAWKWASSHSADNDYMGWNVSHSLCVHICFTHLYTEWFRTNSC